MFRPVDQRFLQIVYDFAVHPEDEDFHTQFAQGYSSERRDEFWPPGGGTRHRANRLCSRAQSAERAQECEQINMSYLLGTEIVIR
jgi:hypothetical protein